MNSKEHVVIDRRSFLKTAALTGAMLLPASLSQAAEGDKLVAINDSDAAILRFLAAAELLEADAWQQYNELANNNPDYMEALEKIDDDSPEYVEQNTDDEFSHADFINAFLVAMHRQPVNLDAFRTLPSSQATGAAQIGRLTNLMHLNVDTSWYRRYRSTGNPDFGDTFAQVVNIVDRPAIPLHDGYTEDQIQAIANTAAWHFPMIEQGGSSLYALMSLKTTSPITLRIVTSIGGTEVAHFEIWHDVVGHVAPLDTGDGLVFPDLESDPELDPSMVMPRPCKFIREDLPLCSVIRPTSQKLAGAKAAVKFLTDTGLFFGQSQEFFQLMSQLADAADAATRKF